MTFKRKDGYCTGRGLQVTWCCSYLYMHFVHSLTDQTGGRARWGSLNSSLCFPPLVHCLTSLRTSEFFSGIWLTGIFEKSYYMVLQIEDLIFFSNDRMNLSSFLVLCRFRILLASVFCSPRPVTVTSEHVTSEYCVLFNWRISFPRNGIRCHFWFLLGICAKSVCVPAI